MKQATEIRVTLRAVTVDAGVEASPSRLRAEIAAGIARALAPSPETGPGRSSPLGATVGHALAERLAVTGDLASERRGGAASTADGGRDGK